jgi:DNA-binding transcriptional LysR family regulator
MDSLPFDLNNLHFFVLVVERRGFTAAAEALGVPKSRVSRHIAELEESLGTRLLQRNSRKLELTEAGSEFYGYCLSMMEQARAAHVAMQYRVGAVVGKLRVSVTVAVADLLLTKVIPAFMSKYPHLSVALQATNREVDLIHERIDVAVRGMRAEPVASEIVQSRICTIRWGLLASPAYLAMRPIEALDDLASTDALMYQMLDSPDREWQLYDDAHAQTRQPTKVRLQTDNLTVLKSAALSGLGICELPLYACREELATGALKQVLPAMRPRFGRLALLFPSRRSLTPAARAFADNLKSQLLSLLTPGELMNDDSPVAHAAARVVTPARSTG